MAAARILIVGTCDTKEDEISYMVSCVERVGATALVMDVSVLGETTLQPGIDKHQVAAAAGTTIADIIALDSEDAAMTAMATGAGRLANRHHHDGDVDGLLILGGTMGTDLALDVAAALPFGPPKVILSTVAFSPLIPPARVSPDLTMVLWAGGLYGLNEMSKSSIRTAVGAVVGAASFPDDEPPTRPIVAISSLGTSALRYVIDLVPALESRGYEAAVFHATGMGGRALAQGARAGNFAAVFDFCLQEVVNELFGSQVTSGPDRLDAPGVPRLVGPGGIDMIDALAFAEVPGALAGQEFHQHNRLITSAMATIEQRRTAARFVGETLARSDAPTAFLLPRRGMSEFDRPGGPLHDAEAIAALGDALAKAIRPPVQLHDLDCHINDPLFTATALEIFDDWMAGGVVVRPETSAARSDQRHEVR